MKIVASTKLTRATRAMQDSRAYGQTSNKVFEEAETKPLEEKKTLLVIASSDKGLCGGIHSGLSRFTRRMLEKDSNLDIAIVGEKCKAQLGRSNSKNVVLNFSGIGRDVPTFADAQAIADQLVLLPEEYASIKIIYNKFINAQSYEPVIIEAFSEEAITQSPNFAAFEIDDEVLANLREYSLANSLFWALAEGHACEQSARQNAMDVSIDPSLSCTTILTQVPECLKERWRHDWKIHHLVQQNPTSCHYRRTGRNHHRCYCFGGYVGVVPERRCT
jgi:F-type H+-transporting ATPase subunit gamma